MHYGSHFQIPLLISGFDPSQPLNPYPVLLDFCYYYSYNNSLIIFALRRRISPSRTDSGYGEKTRTNGNEERP